MTNSSYVTSPTSPTQRFPFWGSNHSRQGFRNPHAQRSFRGAAFRLASTGSRQRGPQAVTDAAPASGLSAGMDPSRLTRRIFPLPLVRQVPNQLPIDSPGGAPELQPVSPTPMYSVLSGPSASPPPSW